MVFKCQEDSFLKTFKSKVVKCEETKEPIVSNGKTTKFEGYQVTLEDTIFFPGGGGQPHDVGRLNDIDVVQVVRVGEEALHFTRKPLEVGTEVEMTVSWPRRFDHMQQHSGQHLLSSILEKEFNLPTTSWWLGTEEAYVELEALRVSAYTMEKVEERCNKLIRMALPVTVKICKANDPDLDQASTRGLPKDCTDTIRVIRIGDIDENLCCGTHVTNLCQLQTIKILGAETGKKGKINLKFLVGHRVTNTLQNMLERERSLTVLLKNEPIQHEELVAKMKKTLKITNKYLQNVLSELAKHEINKIKTANPKPKYVYMFKKEATPDFNRAICKGLEDEELFVFLVSEEIDKPNEGQVIMQGPKEHCNALGTQMMEVLNGKGVFMNGKFQGKAGNLKDMNKCKEMLEDYFNTQ